MFRVRKVNRSAMISEDRVNIPRPRLKDFHFRALRLKRRRPMVDSTLLRADRDFATLVDPAWHTSPLIERVSSGQVMSVVVSLNLASWLPTLGDLLHVLTALRLCDLLAERRVCEAVVVIDLRDEDDPASTPLVVQRDGSVASLRSVEDAVGIDDLVRTMREVLPETGFRSELVTQVAALADENRAVAKLRLLCELAGRGRVLPMRNALARKTPLAVLARIVPLREAETTKFDAFGESPIVFPSVMATLVEGKVERWLDKFGLKPEELMELDDHTDVLLDKLLPVGGAGRIGEAKEALLSRVINLGILLKELGFDQERVLDKLTGQVDAQMDRLRHTCANIEASERETARSQLDKCRAYLRPKGELQERVMSALHYQNFYGKGFVESLSSSLEIGDGRHHLVYLET